MKRRIMQALRQLEQNPKLRSIQSVSGGDINEAFFVETDLQQYFVKLNKKQPIDFLRFEMDGLRKISETQTIACPHVYALMEIDDIPLLVMEWIEGRKTKDTETQLGENLAALHLHEGIHFGYEKQGYIGGLKQENALYDDWLTYYRDFRLKGQLERGRAEGRIANDRERRLEKLLEQLERWIPSHPKKSILHGDLWGGNWMIGPEGTPFIIDPSVLYGDHEFELAFTELFGGFNDDFYQSYTSVFPLSDTYEERKELYQLYYLLVHLNLFGESYGSPIDQILKKYVSL